jgi:hypothetical protein
MPLLVAAAAFAPSESAWACPTDVQPRAAGTVLTVQRASQPAQTMDSVALAALPQTTLTQRQTVVSSGSGTTDRAVVYTGVLLPDLLVHSGFATANDRGARTSLVEAVASDGQSRSGSPGSSRRCIAPSTRRSRRWMPCWPRRGSGRTGRHPRRHR